MTQITFTSSGPGDPELTQTTVNASYNGETDVIIVGYTSIGIFAFLNRTSLANITIPDSVTSIGYRAFGNCINFKHVFMSQNELINLNAPGITLVNSLNANFFGATDVTIHITDTPTYMYTQTFLCTNSIDNSFTLQPGNNYTFTVTGGSGGGINKTFVPGTRTGATVIASCSDITQPIPLTIIVGGDADIQGTAGGGLSQIFSNNDNAAAINIIAGGGGGVSDKLYKNNPPLIDHYLGGLPSGVVATTGYAGGGGLFKEV
jgi:hypothetical protein